MGLQQPAVSQNTMTLSSMQQNDRSSPRSVQDVANHDSVSERQNRASREIGNYLLRGWTLTDELCINSTCGCPLMRSPNYEWLCVLCGSVPAPANRSGSTNQASSIQGNATITDESSDAEMMTEIERQRSVIREQTRVNDERESRFHLLSRQDRNLSTQSAQVRTVEDDRRRQTDHVSSLIGQKMLQGWTLLGDMCTTSTCIGVPLVRNREGKALCVACETYYQKEASGENWVSITHLQSFGSASSSAAMTQNTLDVPAPNSSTDIPNATTSQSAPSLPLSASSTAVHTQTISSTANVSIPLPAVSSSSSAGNSAIEATTSVLISKINEYSILLQSCSPSDTQVVMEYLQVIKELLETLAAARRMIRRV